MISPDNIVNVRREGKNISCSVRNKKVSKILEVIDDRG
jgi:hypothetical protein